MRGDYELHFAACERCRSRQKLHRIIDISLIVLASASAAVFLLACYNLWIFGAQHVAPALVQGLLNLVFFLYLVRSEVRDKLR